MPKKKSSNCNEALVKALKDAPGIEERLADHETYWAHLKDGERPETLAEHMRLVVDYARELTEAHGLGEVVGELSSALTADGADSEPVSDFAFKAFAEAILFHDYGKVNANFQSERMRNPRFPSPNTESPLGYRHARLGAYMMSHEKLCEAKTVTASNHKALAQLAFALAYPIVKHHSPKLANFGEDWPFEAAELDAMPPYLKRYGFALNERVHNAIRFFEAKRWDKLIEGVAHFPLYALVKLNFSLLTAADYLATSHYMGGWKEKEKPDLGVIDEELRKRMLKALRENKPYNQAAYAEEARGGQLPPMERFEAPSSQNLNALRQRMAVSVIRTAREEAERGSRLFYLEAPTGGGKTNLSMLALGEMLKARPEDVGKAFYVFPFTTLAEQTRSALADTLGLKPHEIGELHSRAGLNVRAGEDDVYGSDKKAYVDRLFAHFPVCVLSHVRFFEALKGCRKESNYLLHRLANSVVVIDELQSYPPQHWDKLAWWVRQYSEAFNVRFVLMSATLPKIDTLVKAEGETPFVDLLANAKQYFQNPNFAGRVAFDFSMRADANGKALPPAKREERDKRIGSLAERVFDEAEKYAASSLHNTAHVIVEFIYKRSAGEFAQKMEALCQKRRAAGQWAFDEVMTLSGTVLEPRRRDVIALLKAKESRSKNVLLVSTQVVEAGVDIDMDLGFKDASLPDSDEQLAGRVNRNASKAGCKVFGFSLDEPKYVYGQDPRFAKARETPRQELERILEEKDFHSLYNKVFAGIAERNESESYVNLSGYLDAVRRLDFTAVDGGFKIIDAQTLSVFVPVEWEARHFEPNERAWLKEKGVVMDESEPVLGGKVWELYESLVTNRGEDFAQDRADMARLQAVMSKFTFSLFAEGKDARQVLERCGEERFGYAYFEGYEEFYDKETGLNSEKLSEEAQFI